jgi:citrate lyase beta subunit
MPSRRALLFCPATEWRRLAKAAGLRADGVILDLEDGVALTRKTEARETAARALAELDFGPSERLVRVNPADAGMEEDVRATLMGEHPPDGYVLPKAGRAADVRDFSRLLRAREVRARLPQGRIRILAIIETALGIVNLGEIAGADPRLDALIFGAEDLCGDIGGRRTREGREVAYARSAVAIHAAARRIQAIDTPYVDLVDEAGLLTETQEALALGYSGKLAIHPKQVEPIQAAFTPGPEEIEAARRLIEEHDRQQDSGVGVFASGGRMVDMPMVRAARAVLARARAAGVGIAAED